MSPVCFLQQLELLCYFIISILLALLSKVRGGIFFFVFERSVVYRFFLRVCGFFQSKGNTQYIFISCFLSVPHAVLSHWAYLNHCLLNKRRVEECQSIWLTLSWMTTPAMLKVIQQNNMAQVQKQFFTDVAPRNSHQFSRRVNHKKGTASLFEMWGRGRRGRFAGQIYPARNHRETVIDCGRNQLWNTGCFGLLTGRAPLVRCLWGCKSSI